MSGSFPVFLCWNKQRVKCLSQQVWETPWETCDRNCRVDVWQSTQHVKGSHSKRQHIAQINNNSTRALRQSIWLVAHFHDSESAMSFPSAMSPISKTIDQSNVVFIRAYWPCDNNFDHMNFYCSWQNTFCSMLWPLSWAKFKWEKIILTIFRPRFWFGYVE